MLQLVSAGAAANPNTGIAGRLIDLAEYAHPAERAAVWQRLAPGATESAPTGVIVDGAVDAGDLERAAKAGVRIVVINDAESAAQLRRAGELLDGTGTAAALVGRLTTGHGLHTARDLAAAHPRVAGLWYAPADLVVDFDDEPSMLYLYDSGESRLAAPAWTRSMLLTVARAFGIDLWGQLDLSFAGPPPDAEATRALRLARMSGFDILVTRHAGAADTRTAAAGSAMSSAAER